MKILGTSFGVGMEIYYVLRKGNVSCLSATPHYTPSLNVQRRIIITALCWSIREVLATVGKIKPAEVDWMS